MDSARTSPRNTPAPATRTRVLLAEDDATVRHFVQRALGGVGLTITAVPDGDQAQAQIAERAFDLVLTDLCLPYADGYAVLDASLLHQPRTPVIVGTAVGSMAECVRAMRAGAFDFISKPYDLALLRATVLAALETPGGDSCGSQRAALASFVGKTDAALALLDQIERVADTTATVLISGETGSGKEVVARALHQASRRATGPFVALNCGAIPEGLVDCELFGHTAGAFTGARTASAGRVREANCGTLFLDEVGDLPLSLQTRLLRVLQERQVTPVGSGTTHPIDVRFVAATHRDLGAMVRAGQFREDLYFRLNVVPIELPPLRSRVEDIPVLAAHFLARMRRGQKPLSLSERALTLLCMYHWPGNVRELEHAIERMVILDRDGIIDVDDLPERLRCEEASQAIQGLEAGLDACPQRGGAMELGVAVARFERALIDNALRATGGNQSKAALLLGIGRTTLLDKLKRRR